MYYEYEYDTTSVSYTHLDVYKRQGSERIKGVYNQASMKKYYEEQKFKIKRKEFGIYFKIN